MKSRLLKVLSRNDRMLIWALLAMLCMVSCAKHPVSKNHVKVTQKNPVVVATAATTMTPERKAAQNLVAEGRAALAAQNNGKATDLFQEAISVDPTAGEAYFELSKLKLQEGSLEEAQNLLEKATSLLSHEPDWETVWQSQVDSLKVQIVH